MFALAYTAMLSNLLPLVWREWEYVRMWGETHTFGGSQDRGVPGRRPIPFSSVFNFRGCQCNVHMCVWSCKQALLMKRRGSRESCSHFKHHLFITPLCAGLTCTDANTCGDRNSAACTITHQWSTSFLCPAAFPPPPSFLPSLKINKMFRDPKLCFKQYSSEGKKKTTSSHTLWIFINFTRRRLVNGGHLAWHTLIETYEHTPTSHYHSFRQSLCLLLQQFDSDLWRKGVTLNPDKHKNSKQGY